MKDVDKRKDITKAALKLIAKHGFHRAPMALIANQAGVSAGTIYRYFESKDVLIRELFIELREKIIAELNEGYSVDKPLWERFKHLGTRLTRYFIKHPIHFRFIEQYMNSPYGVRFRRELSSGTLENVDVFKNLFEQGIAQQVIKDFPSPMQYALALGPLTFLARDHILGFIRLDDAMIVKIVEACWDAIKR